MVNFDVALNFVLNNEGGFVDNLNDAGGATNCGLSLRFLRDLSEDRLRKYGIFKEGDDLNVEDIKNLTSDQIRLIYKGEFWDDVGLDQLIDPYVGSYIFDMCVLHGKTQGIKIAQRAVWALKQKAYEIPDDGILGQESINAINSSIPRNLECVLMSERAGYMRLVCNARPKDKEFLNGWLERCYRI